MNTPNNSDAFSTGSVRVSSQARACNSLPVAPWMAAEARRKQIAQACQERNMMFKQADAHQFEFRSLFPFDAVVCFESSSKAELSRTKAVSVRANG
jgi:hypothetical protein